MQAPKNGSSSFEKHPEGPAALVCTRIIDKGTITTMRNGLPESKRKIVLAFESSEMMAPKDDQPAKPFMVFANFNFSMYKNSTLCKFIEAWRGKQFEDQDEADNYGLEVLLGKHMFANIVHNGDFVNIISPMPVPKGIPKPTPVGELILFSFQTPDAKAFEKLGENLQEKMKTTPEYQEWMDSNIPKPQAKSEEPPKPESGDPGKDFDDDIPF